MLSLVVMSQTIPDAKRLIYYERYKSSKDLIHNILKTDPDNAEGWYLLSQAYLLSDNADWLQAMLLQSPPVVRNQPFYQVAYGYLLLFEDNKESARYYFDLALDETKGKAPDILFAIANAHINTKAGNAGYAVQLLEKAIKKDKKTPALYVLLGDAYRKLGNGSEAYKSYQAAIDLDNTYAGALYRMGKIFVSQKNPEMYLKYFTQAIQTDSNYAPALYEMYYHYYFTDAQKAIAYFQEYLAKSDFNKINAYRYVDLLYMNEHYQPAIEIAQKLLTVQGSDSIPLLYKLAAYSCLGLKDTGNTA